jgi:hypothetical protein
MVKILLVASGALMFASAEADHLIHIPLGKKVPSGTFRMSFGSAQDDFTQLHCNLDVGLGDYVDASLRTDDINPSDRKLAVDLSYNILSPVTGFSPGISFGVQDVADRTTDGRRYYFATTFKVDLEVEQLAYNPAEVTMGVLSGRYTNPFVGVMLPFAPQWRAKFEHDGIRINTGFEYRPRHDVALKYDFIDAKPQFAVGYQSRF